MSSTAQSFTVDSDILLELGERLVANKSTALAELVKNSYDADSPDVVVTLLNVTSPGGTIIVEDNGHGMDYNAVVHGWFRIATDRKKKKIRSPKYERIFTGSKGIGRFACRVLSNSLKLETIGKAKKGNKEKITLMIEWLKFKSGTDVSSIPILISREPVPDTSKTYTTIELIDTREAWFEKEIKNLKNKLLTLLSPFPQSKKEEKKPKKRKKSLDPGFIINLESKEFKLTGPIGEEEFLKYAFGRIEGKIENGIPTYELKFRLMKKTLTYHPKNIKYHTVGPCDFIIDYFVYTGDYFKGIPLKVRDASAKGRESGGVRIYLDDFRVPPYGEPGDDWLKLDERRGRSLTTFRVYADKISKELDRPALLIPGNNQLFGVVRISRIDNPDIEVSITREKLVENPSFSELTDFVIAGIEWLTIEYAKWASEKKEKASDPVVPIKRAKSVISRSKNIPSLLKTELIGHLDTALKAVEDFKKEQITEIAMLRVLASTGTMITMYQHELNLMTGEITRLNEKLKRNIDEDIQDKAAFRVIASDIDSWINMTIQYASNIGVMIGKESRIERKSISLYSLINNLDQVFLNYFDEYNITFTNNVKRGVFMPNMFVCEMYALFLNVITNSIKSVKKVDNRKIEINAKKKDAKIVINVLDTGVGVPSEMRREVFKPFVTDSEEDPFLGKGTGLGLAIVKNIVENYGGSVEFLDPSDEWKAKLQILLELEENE